MNELSVKNKKGTKGDDGAAGFEARRFIKLFQHSA
jgi:hypothetical protein